jgi:tripartite-type tricarboxylate transporter receptor subunit TctC
VSSLLIVGNRSSSYLAIELLKTMTGTVVVHVPFSGSGQSARAAGRTSADDF